MVNGRTEIWFGIFPCLKNTVLKNKKRKYQNIASAIYVLGMVRDMEDGNSFALLVDAVSRSSCLQTSTFCIYALIPYKVL